MTQPPPYSPHPGPYPPGPPRTSRNTGLWIVLGVVGVLLLLCCGGVVTVGVLAVQGVNEAIEEERRNDRPREVEIGESFEHDDYEGAAGWSVTRDQSGDFAITDLTVTNDSERARTANLRFSFHRDDTVIAEVTCHSATLQPDEKGLMDCYSSDDFTQDYDAVKVADTY